jgi:hypothetical protein
MSEQVSVKTEASVGTLRAPRDKRAEDSGGHRGRW